MKIHSKFKDYYDSAMAYGVDDHVHWVRKTSEIQIGGPDPGKQMLEGAPHNHPQIDVIPEHTFVNSNMFNERPAESASAFRHRVFRHEELQPDRENFFIGFCGLLYYGIKFSWDRSYDGENKTVRFAYSVDDIIKVLREYDKKFKTKNAAEFRNNTDDTPSWGRKYRFNKKGVTAYLALYQGAEHIKFFTDLNSPIFSVIKHDAWPCIEVNPVLKDYGFQSVMDPFTAYQEIEMFMGGVLAELDEIDVPGVSDESLKAGKGFDKWSFKTMPTKKR